jgi:hypothetical protein
MPGCHPTASGLAARQPRDRQLQPIVRQCVMAILKMVKIYVKIFAILRMKIAQQFEMMSIIYIYWSC